MQKWNESQWKVLLPNVFSIIKTSYGESHGPSTSPNWKKSLEHNCTYILHSLYMKQKKDKIS